jgi:predicted lactoylglutathione lyase
MKSHISLITLGVKDLEKSTSFYKTIGFPVEVADDITFIKMPNLWMSLYPLHKLADDAGVENNKSGFSGITLAHNVLSKDQVDSVFKELQKCEVNIIDKPHEREWGGYSGYFSDVDGYVWEVAFNPYSPEIAVDENS